VDRIAALTLGHFFVARRPGELINNNYMLSLT
jgi:hypothetical protein